jgi:DNA primase
MIPRTDLPTISEILSRLDVPLGRNGRALCPIHRGNNRQAFSFSDDKGAWHCFRCGFGGDVVTLIEKALETDFKGALRWLGIELAKPPAPDPAVVRRQRARAGLKAWAKQTGKELRDEFLTRERVITRALARLRKDPSDRWAWNWLEWAFRDHAQIEYKLDLLIGKEEAQLEAFRQWRAAA